MPVFTTAAAAIVGTTALTGIGASIATSIIASGLAYGTGHLLGVFDAPGGSLVDEGVDIRLAPNTQNRLPILLGAFQQRGIAVYYEVSEDRQNLHTVVALGEGPITSINEIYWEDLLLTLDANGVVTDATDRDGVSVDRLNGLVTVQTYLGTSTGNNSTYLEGLSELWTENHKMTNIAYAVVSVKYDRESEVTGLGDMRFIGTGANDNPSDVVKDLLENPRYGLDLDSGLIDSSSFTAAATYYDELITYEDTNGVDQMQKRHRVNGVLNTGDTVLQRIETVLNGCNSSLRWSNGRWGIFVNKEETATTFEFDSSNIIGSVSIVETGLNNLFNRIEVQYGRNADNNWQRATAYVESPASVRYPNELDRTMTLNLPLVSTSVEAKAAATVILNQGRQQLTVKHNADATAMPLEAGDVVSYTKAELGWSGKLFRIVEVTEMESRGALEYSITAIEYADAVYDYGVLNEDDVAPNVPVVDVAVIEAVDDLSITGTFRAAATPYIGLAWTVPDNSLIESFSVFYNTVNETFDSGNTKLGGIERIPVGNYTAGDMVSHQLVGVPAGNVSIWVVGTNSFVSSAESNQVEVANWDPVVMIGGDFEIGTRYNETPSVINGVDIDVGAPPANATGTGTGRNNDTNDTGWYIFDPEATDRENAPVWTATAEVERTGAEPREIDFTFSGTAATQTTTFTPETQETDFTFSGNVGEREFFYNARPQITNFTLSGQSADFDTGVAAQWEIDVTGSTEATGTNTNDVFYIAPRGSANVYQGQMVKITPSGNTNSGLSQGASFTLTPSGSTSDGVSQFEDIVSGATTQFTGSSQTSDYGFQIVNVAGNAFLTTLSSTNTTDFGNLRINGLSSTERTTLNNLLSGLTDKDLRIQVNSVEFLIEDFGIVLNQGDQLRIDVSSATVTYSGTGSIPANTSGITLQYQSNDSASSTVTITLDSETNSYTLSDNLSGGAVVGAALNTAIGTDYDDDWVKTFDAITGAITFTADDLNSHTGSASVAAGTNGTLQVDVSETTVIISQPTVVTLFILGINASFTLPDGLVGAAAVGDALNTVIGDSYNDRAIKTFDAVTGIISFESILITNLSATATIDNGTDGTVALAVAAADIVGTVTRMRIQIPTASVDESISIQSGLTGQALRDNLHLRISTRFEISTKFTVELVTIDIDGTPTEVIRLTADDFVDHMFVVSINVGLDGTTTGTISDGGGGAGQATTIRIAYDNSIVPGLQDVTFGAGDNINVASELAVLIESHAGLSASNSGATVTVTNDADGPVDEPVITITEQGTGDVAFAISTDRVGVTAAGTASSYVITHAGLQVAGGNFTAASSANSMATQLTTAINSTSVITGSTSSNVSTATSVANSTSTTLVAITGGTNKPGGTSTNDAASVGAVSQVGSAIDAYGGVDSVVNVFNGGELYYTQSYNGGTREDLVADVVDGINFDNPLFTNFFTAGVQADNTDEIVATSDFVGTTPTLTISVVPGFTATVDSVGNITQVASTLGVVRTVVSDGQSDPVISGTLSTYTVSQGGTEVISATNLSSGLSSSAVTMAISSAVAASADIDYTTGVDGSVLTTTSTFNDSIPDLVITVTPGTNADATLGDLQVVKVVTQDGDPGTLDFTDAVWTYAVTAPTTDNDTTMIGTDGTIQVRRGLVLDTTAAEEISDATETEVLFVSDADSHTTGSRPSTLVVQGSVSMPALTVSTAGAALGFIFEQSTDYDTDNPADATWTAIQTSVQVGLTAATAYVGQVVNVALPIATTFDADASTKYFFRARRNGVSENTDLASGIAGGFLIIEELRT